MDIMTTIGDGPGWLAFIAAAAILAGHGLRIIIRAAHIRNQIRERLAREL